ncbi:MAG: trypsin-like peptidase domain-containing protein [Oscillospiraceae bacterium]|jgi:serine protease Do|nr:trypsin-like peptidase domain-containing protein [Oscillospiraceae bacterium]
MGNFFDENNGQEQPNSGSENSGLGQDNTPAGTNEQGGGQNSGQPYASYNNAYPYNDQNNGYPYSQQPPAYRPPSYQPPQYGAGGIGPKKKGAGTRVLAVLVAFAILAAGAGLGYSLRTGGRENTTAYEGGIENAPSINFNQTPAPEATTSPKGELEPSEVYKKIRESSVGLLVYSTQTRGLFTEGSGVILGEDTDGVYTYIITCAHVISEPDVSVRIQLHNATEYDAQVIGYDNRTDTGVVRIKANGLKAAEFADSSMVQVGQTVYAIGNPGGVEFAGSFTSGMVSALDRPISSSQSRYTMECIQHQAAINPGNSGGALVNAYGQVIGINSSKLVAGYEGMGFAVPSKVFQGVVDQIIANGYVPNRPKLGISYAPASAFQTYYMVLKMKDLPAGSLVIQAIASDSSLVGTQIRVNDMIIAVNGENLATVDQLPTLIENAKVGDHLRLKIARVEQDYSVTEFEETITLVEDRGSVPFSQDSETTTAASPDPFEDFTFPNDLY